MNYLKWALGILTIAGVIGGTVTFADGGKIRMDSGVVIDDSGIRLEADGTDYNTIRWESSSVDDEVLTLGAYKNGDTHNGTVILTGDDVNDVLALWIAVKDYSTAARIKLANNPAIGLNQVLIYAGANPTLTINSDGAVVTGAAQIGAADAFYFGGQTTDDSWRIVRSGNNLVFERRESGSWVTKSTMTP